MANTFLLGIFCKYYHPSTFHTNILKYRNTNQMQFVAIKQLKKREVLYFNNLKSSYLPKNALCQVWMKLAQWFWRSRKCNKFTDRQKPNKTDQKEKLTSGELNKLSDYSVLRLNTTFFLIFSFFFIPASWIFPPPIYRTKFSFYMIVFYLDI